jgi:hypothetical protein
MGSSWTRRAPDRRWARQHDNLPATRLVEGPVRKIEIVGEQKVDVRIGEDLAPAVDDRRLVELAERRMGGEHLVELLLVEGQHHPVAQRRDHGEGGIAQALLMLLQIGLGDDHRIRDRRIHPLAEPGIDPEVQEQGGEDRHDDRGRHGRDAEEQHHAGMQPGARQAPAALDPQGHQPAGEEDAEQQQDDQIDEKQDDAVRPLPWASPKLPVSTP